MWKKILRHQDKSKTKSTRLSRTSRWTALKRGKKGFDYLSIRSGGEEIITIKYEKGLDFIKKVNRLMAINKIISIDGVSARTLYKRFYYYDMNLKLTWDKTWEKCIVTINSGNTRPECKLRYSHNAPIRPQEAL